MMLCVSVFASGKAERVAVPAICCWPPYEKPYAIRLAAELDRLPVRVVCVGDSLRLSARPCIARSRR